jgi:carboxyl-terminal processing protease
MKKFYLIIILFPLVIFSKELKIKDINSVMQKILDYHVEFNKLQDVIISRSFKLYIDQFDPLKIYLLENEVKNYLDLNQTDLNKILTKINNDDFSDYLKLNEIFQKSIIRAKKIREKITKDLLKYDINAPIAKNNYSNFASNVDDLGSRIKNSLLIFQMGQLKRSAINSVERKQKVFNLLERKLSRNESLYLEDSSEHLLSLNILKACVKSLDAHSYYFSEDEAEQMRLALEKEFEGIGIVLSESIDGVIVTDLVKNSPAQESGVINVNDIVTEVNGKSVEYLSFDKVMKLMKEKDSSYIIMGFKRILNDNNTAFWRVKLEKKPISMDDQRLGYSFEPVADGVIGKLELKSFYENTNGVTSEKDIKNAIRNLRKNADLKGLVLDLRENAGGFLSQAIKVAALFIKNGVVVISKSSNKEMRYLRNLEGDAFYNGPLVILTSKLSASASEIVAAALQDYGVAIIVGDETTFGKGSIQYQTVTDKKADYFYKVTVGKYYTVSGKTTQIEGVRADIIVPSSFSPYKIGERFLQYPLQADIVKEAYDDKLLDIDNKIKFWFKQNYLPNLQKKVTFWQKMIPVLKENSTTRLNNNLDFQNFLKKQKEIEAKINGKDIEIPDDNSGFDDLQLKEAVNIIKDMINIEADKTKAAGF